MLTKQNEKNSNNNQSDPQKTAECFPSEYSMPLFRRMQEKIDKFTIEMMQLHCDFKKRIENTENIEDDRTDLRNKIEAQEMIIEKKKNKMLETEQMRLSEKEKKSNGVDTLSEQILKLTEERNRLFDENNLQKNMLNALKSDVSSREQCFRDFGEANSDGFGIKKESNPKADKLNELLEIVTKIKCSYNSLMYAHEIQ